MSAGLLVDTHGFTKFIEDLARLSGKEFLPVLLDQAGTVLDLCIARSPNPWKGKGREKVRHYVELRIQKPGRYIGDSGTLVGRENRVPRPVPTGTLQTLTGSRGGEKGREWYVGEDRQRKRIYVPQERMLGNEKFHRRQGIKFALYEMVKPKIVQAIESIGSVAASWVWIADAIGAPLRKAPAWVKQVRSKIDDGSKSRIHIDSMQTFVELVNTNALLINKYSGANILQGAIDTRLKDYERAVKKGWIDDMAFRAKRYPGIFVS